MLGVVLWSDKNKGKAVVWCEDQGDLAFFRDTGTTDKMSVDVGDWIEFDLVTERQLRLVRNPRFVGGGSEVQALLHSSTADNPQMGTTERSDTAEIIPFAPILADIAAQDEGDKVRHA